MDCSRAVKLAAGRLNDSISGEHQAALDRHLGECELCAKWNLVVQVAEAWKSYDAGDPDPLSYVKSSNSWHGQQLASGERLIIEGYPPGEIDGVDEYFVAAPTEWIFLTTRRFELRRLVADMELLGEQTGSEVVSDSLRRLREHIRWADDLAVGSGVPSECVYPPPTDGRPD